MNDYCIKSGDYRIALVRVNGEKRYECWHHANGIAVNIGTRFEPEVARELCEQHAMQEQAA